MARTIGLIEPKEKKGTSKKPKTQPEIEPEKKKEEAAMEVKPEEMAEPRK